MIKNDSLFDGTAYYYSKYRPEFPKELIDFIVKTYQLDGTGTLLDMGCGTGLSTFPFSKYFEKIIAFDRDKEMLDVALSKNQVNSNITFLLQSDEDIKDTSGPCKLIIASRSFHWMRQEELLQKLHKILAKNGSFVIISDGSFWGGNETWEKTIKKVIQSFLGEQRRAGNSTFQTSNEPYTNMLQRHGYKNVREFAIPITRIWTIESIIGYLYSTSFSAKHLYKDHLQEFEKTLKKDLLELNDGKNEFIEHTIFTITSGQN